MNLKKRGGSRRCQHIGCAKAAVAGDTLLCCQAHQEIEVIELAMLALKQQLIELVDY
jgi:hypothetical protein